MINVISWIKLLAHSSWIPKKYVLGHLNLEFYVENKVDRNKSTLLLAPLNAQRTLQLDENEMKQLKNVSQKRINASE